MNIEDIRDYALAKEDTTEGFPFGENALVFKVNGKMFLLLSLNEQPPTFNVKCDPEVAIRLRADYPSVLPGFHMNKQHWNTVVMDGSLTTHQIREMIDWSYSLVSKKKK